MYQFVSGFINITELSWCSMAGMHHICLSANIPFASHLTFVYALIIGLLLILLRKPSFTASPTSPRMLFHTKPCPKSTCYRFEFRLSKTPGRRKCIPRSLFLMITWQTKFDLCAELRKKLTLSGCLLFIYLGLHSNYIYAFACSFGYRKS